jgi:ABC-type branched-subunit amino acid transport system ATPase component/ABC-type branched-subunit amino acid transport system permease subunit
MFFSQETILFVFLGLATGALTALVALGIVLVYRSSGVLNFAASALGGIGAWVCYSIRGDGVPTGLAVAAGVLVGCLLGVLTYFVLMVFLRGTSLLAKLIATLALFSSAEGFMYLKWGTVVMQPSSFLPSSNVTLWGSVTIGVDRLILIGISVVLGVVLHLVYSRTTFGLATSAVAENPRVVASSGWSPGRIQIINFAVAGTLSAIAAILLAPIITLDAAVLSTAVISALAAALVGGFSSFGVTVGAALVIGVLQSELSLFSSNISGIFGFSQYSLTNIGEAAPLVIILVYMIAAGRSRMQRGETLIRLPLPGSGRISLIPLVAGVVLAAVLLVTVSSWTTGLISTMALGIVVCSVVVVTGYTGQLSLCQFALAGFGAWVAGWLLSSSGWSLQAALPVAAVATTLVGLVIALPALRTRGTNLAIVTLAVALIFGDMIFNNGSVTGGIAGLQVNNLTFFGIGINPLVRPKLYGALVLCLLVLIGLVVANVRRGRVGRRLLAVRSNERAAASLGIKVSTVKLYAFGLGAAIAAVGGVMYAAQQPNIEFSQYDVIGSILLIEFAVLTGVGWVSGAGVAAIIAPTALVGVILTNILPSNIDIADWLALVSGVAVIVLLRQAPDGGAAVLSRTFGRYLSHFQIRPRAVSQTPVAVDEHPGGTHTRQRVPVSLAVRGVSVRFGGVVAVDDVSFEVAPGEVVGLIGPNGAGKTTLLDVMTGFTKQTEGSVLLDGVSIDSWSVEKRARRGLSRSWQAVELFEAMTVRDNLLAAADDQAASYYWTDLVRPNRRQDARLVDELVAEFGLGDVLDERPSSLSHGVARLVGICRAIVAEPAVLLLDEPAAGLDAEATTELGTAIRRIAHTRGIGVLVIEHDVPLLLRICDRLVALDFGQKIADGSPQDVSSDDAVVRAYLGLAEPTDAAAESVAATGDAA